MTTRTEMREEASQADDSLGRITRGTARIASVTGLRQIISTGLLAATAAVVARALGPGEFGVYVGGTAAFNLAMALTDLGFSVVALREMAQRPDEQGRLLFATMQVQTVWSASIAVGLVALGLAAGGDRGSVMLALSPAVALAGLGASRQLFAVRYRALPVLVVDLSLSIVQAVGVIGLALAHAGVIALAATLSVTSCLNGIIVTVLVRRVVVAERPRRGERMGILWAALPLGIVSILASLYFTIDQVILGWLVPGRVLGHYAAAVRLLNIVVMVPGFVMVAGIPGLSRNARNRATLSRFAATLAHWIAITALPICVGLAVFAAPAIQIAFGPSYGESVELLRILMLAAALSLASNVLGITLMSLSIVRPQLVFNLISLAINVVGNILLVPRYGIAASAWLTIASEAIVVSYGIVVLRRRVDFGVMRERLWRPVAAAAIAALPGLALGADSAYAIAASATVFLIAMFGLRAWPEGLAPRRFQPRPVEG